MRGFEDYQRGAQKYSDRPNVLKMVFTDRRVTATIQLAWGPRDVIEGGTHTTRSVGPVRPRLSNEP